MTLEEVAINAALIQARVAEAVAEEREACARVAEFAARDLGHYKTAQETCEYAAATIRERGNNA